MSITHPVVTLITKANKGGKRVGIIGIGGLGQMGVRLAKAMGNTVTPISTSPNKEAAARDIGADKYSNTDMYKITFNVSFFKALLYRLILTA